MHPVLLQLGPVALPTYGALLVLAGLSGAAFALASGERSGRPAAGGDGPLLSLLLTALLAALLGAQAAALLLARGGGRSGLWLQPAIAVGLLAAVAALRRARLPVLATIDSLVPALGLGIALGRLGCLAAGCCWGAPAAALPWAVVYVEPRAHALTGVPLGVPLHPYPLYAALAATVELAVTAALIRGGAPAGVPVAAFLVLDGLFRLALAPLRGDGPPSPLPLTSLLAVASVAAGGALLLHVRRLPGALPGLPR